MGWWPVSSASTSTISSTCRSRLRCGRSTTRWTTPLATTASARPSQAWSASLSERQPLLLVVEDVHWADRLTLEHLATLTETVAACPALLVMTSRIDGDPLDHAWRSSIAGSPLDDHRSRPAASARRRPRLPALISMRPRQFAQRCIERAAGNPLFLEQLLRHAEASSAAGVPGSVQSLVQARMDQLASVDKQALQAASILASASRSTRSVMWSSFPTTTALVWRSAF